MDEKDITHELGKLSGMMSTQAEVLKKMDERDERMDARIGKLEETSNANGLAIRELALMNKTMQETLNQSMEANKKTDQLKVKVDRLSDRVKKLEDHNDKVDSLESEIKKEKLKIRGSVIVAVIAAAATVLAAAIKMFF